MIPGKAAYCYKRKVGATCTLQELIDCIAFLCKRIQIYHWHIGRGARINRNRPRQLSSHAAAHYAAGKMENTDFI